MSNPEYLPPNLYHKAVKSINTNRLFNCSVKLRFLEGGNIFLFL